jgi:hypothetical protein
MTEVESSLVAAWREAARDLGVKFTTPFAETLHGEAIHGLGLVHQFGGRVGMIISDLEQPGPWLPDRVKSDYSTSRLSDSYTRYDRKLFIATLNDWQFLGPDSQKPPWYTGKPWGSTR